MIAATLQHARGEAPPPTLLRFAFQNKSWGALPESGGLRDQPAGMLDKMVKLLNVYNAARGYLNAKNVAVWAGSHPELSALYARARSLEISNGK